MYIIFHLAMQHTFLLSMYCDTLHTCGTLCIKIWGGGIRIAFVYLYMCDWGKHPYLYIMNIAIVTNRVAT